MSENIQDLGKGFMYKGLALQGGCSSGKHTQVLGTGFMYKGLALQDCCSSSVIYHSLAIRP